jgi:hypothetical protein
MVKIYDQIFSKNHQLTNICKYPSPVTSSTPNLNSMVFCNQKFALCDSALCHAIPMMPLLGTISTTTSLCTCEVVDDWSLGPGSCEARKAYQSLGITYLFSSYSNYLKKPSMKFLHCPKPITWAWCLGSPCLVDPNNPKQAYCTCPLATSEMFTLGGGCDTQNCNLLWSAAPPSASGTTEFFYERVKNMTGKVMKPVENCPVLSPVSKPTKKVG